MSRDLAKAHEGYLYQDLTTAFAFVDVLVEGGGSVTVDTKLSDGDKFDDLTVRSRNGIIRRQIKWASSAERQLSLDDFAATGSHVRLDLLVLSQKASGALVPNAESRLAVSWLAPSDSQLLDLLRESDDPSSIPGAQTARYRFRIESLWPEGGVPALPALASLSRTDVVSFVSSFVIEVAVPRMSRDLAAPGPFEQLLLGHLVRRLGIGEYPNHNRDPTDVLSRFLSLATQARTQHLTLGYDEIARRVHLRVDYGHVAQRFPIQEPANIVREAFHQAVAQALGESQLVGIVGSPGSGKSWTLTRLAQELRAAGHLVARHYCYLEPGDADVEQRIRADVLFANLITELLAQDPALRDAKEALLAANREELESMLAAAVKARPGKHVILMVDGLDHIARVAATAPTLARSEIDIPESLAAMALPSGAKLLIGSQPGAHLDRLGAECRRIEVPAWSDEELRRLCDRLALPAALQVAGHEAAPIIAKLVDLAGHSPLHGTYLARGLRHVLETGAILPEDWLRDIPEIHGDLERYYDYLDAPGAAMAPVSNVLGLLEFAATRAELREIVGPTSAPYLERALDRLAPVLVEVAGQGGIRIFHESFRRFVLARLQRDGVPLADALAPVTAWLDKRGFLEDARAFRYLLPALRRSNRDDELFSFVEHDYVARAVGFGHEREATERNLRIAAEAAADGLCWPRLVRCSELGRASWTCFEEHLDQSTDYWRTFTVVRGARLAADRLHFEGRPVLPRMAGLLACASVELAGGNPPWAEYLALDPVEIKVEDAPWYLAAIVLGRLRTRGADVTRAWFQSSLVADEWLSDVALAVGETLQLAGEGEFLRELLSLIPSPEDASLLLLGAAEALRSQGSRSGAASLATEALKGTRSISHWARGLLLGAVVERDDMPEANPSLFDIASTQYPESDRMQSWLDHLTVLARTEPDRLADVERSVAGDFWYRNWLTFVVAIVRAETKVGGRDAASAEACEAFKLLTKDSDPFKGEPRAVDLTLCRPAIARTIQRGLRLLETGEHWKSAFGALREAAQGTDASLQRSPWGPIPPLEVLDLLEPFASTPHAASLVRQSIEDVTREAQAKGAFSSNLAESSMCAARMLVALGDRAAAVAAWDEAARLLAGYGWRKDVTIFELIEGIAAFSEPSEVMDRCEEAWPLCEAVLADTDGKETRHAPNSLFDVLAARAPSYALQLAASSEASEGGVADWMIEEAMNEAVTAAVELADPLLVMCAQGMFRFAFSSEHHALEAASRCIIPIAKITNRENAEAGWLGARLSARADGDGKKVFSSAFRQISAQLRALGIVTPVAPSIRPAGNSDADDAQVTPSQKPIAAVTIGQLPDDPRLAQVVAWARTEWKRIPYGPEQNSARDALMAALSARCRELAATGAEADVVRLCRVIAVEMLRWERAGSSPIADLGNEFAAQGRPELGATLLILAYCHTRGGRGWHSVGGQEHAAWVSRAIAVDAVSAKRAFAEEVVRVFLRDGYVMGVTPAIIQRVAGWGDLEGARSAWEEARRTIKNRLPTTATPHLFLRRFVRSDFEAFTVDEGVISAMLARASHFEADRRRSALLALSVAFVRAPGISVRPLRNALGRDGSPTFARVILKLLLETEAAPFVITTAIRDVLGDLCRGGPYGAAVIASALLGRASLTPPGIPGAEVSFDGLESGTHKFGGARVARLRALWPQYDSAVSKLVFALRPKSPPRARWRYEFAREHERDIRYFTPFITWDAEVLDEALANATQGISELLWRQGSPDAVTPRDAVELVGPDLRTWIALEASRTGRPADAPLPTAMSVGTSTLPILPADDALAGWVRLAWYERELVFSERGFWKDPVDEVHGAGGCVSGQISLSDVRGLPWGVGDSRYWFNPALDRRRVGVTFTGPLVGGFMLDDLLGRRHVFVLHPAFAQRHRLRPGPWPGRLLWTDDAGDARVVLRDWRVGAINDESGEEPSVLEGCELIVHPDLFEKMKNDCSGTLAYFSTTFRHSDRDAEGDGSDAV